MGSNQSSPKASKVERRHASKKRRKVKRSKTKRSTAASTTATSSSAYSTSKKSKKSVKSHSKPEFIDKIDRNIVLDETESGISSQDSCPFCSENHDEDELLYCGKGSLCSRRSRATVLSKKVKGLRKRRPGVGPRQRTPLSLVNSSSSTGSGGLNHNGELTSGSEEKINFNIQTIRTPENKTKVTHFKSVALIDITPTPSFLISGIFSSRKWFVGTCCCC